MMKITFKPMSPAELPLWEKWITFPHVKSAWFQEGYEPPEAIHNKIKGNGTTHPFIILADTHPIGYIQSCDLYAYNRLCPQKTGLFIHEPPGTFCMDLFIAEPHYLDKGIGTETVHEFCQFIFNRFFALRMLIDPDVHNKRAIRCYEKAGFQKIETKNDGINDCLILEKINSINEQRNALSPFLNKMIQWSYDQRDISSLGLVGSYAKGTAHTDSDIDLIFLTQSKNKYVENHQWLEQFGPIESIKIKEYGKVTSLHVFYQNSYEVEFSFADESWADIPIDTGIKQVILDGFCILVDKLGKLNHLTSKTN